MEGFEMYKYCVANVYVNLEGAHVTYYAYGNNQYGLHLIDDWRDNCVIWYDTEKEAMKHRINAEDCVLSFCIDYIPKFRK